MMEERYYIIRVLNNNTILCFDNLEKRECILLGSGIGFGKKKKDYVVPSTIEKLFVIGNTKNLNKYQQLVSSCDELLVETTEWIIEQLEIEFKTPYNEYLHIALLDHLNFSIYRYDHQIEVPNIFLEELAMMYQKEYQFSSKMLQHVNEKLKIQLPESEIAFITMHVHAALRNKKVSKASLYAEIIGDSLQCIEEELQLKDGITSLERSRLIMHLKFALERQRNHTPLTNPITKSLKKEYPKTYQIATKLAGRINDRYGIYLPDGEIGYLTLHIQNIIMEDEK